MALLRWPRSWLVASFLTVTVLAGVLNGEDRLPVGNALVDINLDRKARTLINGLPMYEVSISKKMLWMIVDTGASSSCLFYPSKDVGWIERPIDTTILETPSGKISVERLRGVGVSVANMPRREVNLALFATNMPSMHLDSRVDGILGTDYFGQDVVSFCLAKGLINFDASARDFSNATRIDLRRSQGRVYMPVNCGFPQFQYVAIDTGASIALALEPKLCQSLERAGLAVQLPVGRVATVAGSTTKKRYILKRCQVAGHEFKNIPLSESLIPLMGTGLLAEFDFVLDLNQNYALFRKSSDAKPNWALVPGLSGLHLHLTTSHERNCVVESIDDKSPAMEAGFLAGDVILKVDGDAAEKIGIRKIMERLKQSGKTLHIEVKRDDQQVALDLRLRWPIKYPPDWPPERAIQQAPLLPE